MTPEHLPNSPGDDLQREETLRNTLPPDVQKRYEYRNRYGRKALDLNAVSADQRMQLFEQQSVRFSENLRTVEERALNMEHALLSQTSPDPVLEQKQLDIADRMGKERARFNSKITFLQNVEGPADLTAEQRSFLSASYAHLLDPRLMRDAGEVETVLLLTLQHRLALVEEMQNTLDTFAAEIVRSPEDAARQRTANNIEQLRAERGLSDSGNTKLNRQSAARKPKKKTRLPIPQRAPSPEKSAATPSARAAAPEPATAPAETSSSVESNEQSEAQDLSHLTEEERKNVERWNILDRIKSTILDPAQEQYNQAFGSVESPILPSQEVARTYYDALKTYMEALGQDDLHYKTYQLMCEVTAQGAVEYCMEKAAELSQKGNGRTPEETQALYKTMQDIDAWFTEPLSPNLLEQYPPQHRIHTYKRLLGEWKKQFPEWNGKESPASTQKSNEPSPAAENAKETTPKAPKVKKMLTFDDLQRKTSVAHIEYTANKTNRTASAYWRALRAEQRMAEKMGDTDAAAKIDASLAQLVEEMIAKNMQDIAIVRVKERRSTKETKELYGAIRVLDKLSQTAFISKEMKTALNTQLEDLKQEFPYWSRRAGAEERQEEITQASEEQHTDLMEGI